MWSPRWPSSQLSGSRFSADTGGDEQWQIYRIGLADDQPEALTNAPRTQHYVALGDPFSPDGRLLAYAGNDRVRVLERRAVDRDEHRARVVSGAVCAGALQWARA